MKLSRLFTIVGGLALLMHAPPLAANPLVREIDIRPIMSRHPRLGNGEALAVNAGAQVMYLSQGPGSDDGAYLYTLDWNGALLAELNWTTFYGPNSWPAGLAYDAATGRLHMLVILHDPTFHIFSAKIVDIDPSGPTILGEFPIDDTRNGFERRADGYWAVISPPAYLRHFDLGGAFIEDVPIGDFGPELLGVSGLASSFAPDGFFVSDHLGRRIIEVDRQGNVLRVGSTSFLPIGGCIAFESDTAARLLYVQAGNMVIYVLNEEVMEIPTVLEQATWGSLKTRYR